MLSRVANSIYWMARYIERAENTARFVNVADDMTLGQSGARSAPDGSRGSAEAREWSPLISAVGDDETYAEAYGDVTAAGVAQFLLLDRDNPNSVFSCVAAARENARTVRESISSEMWNEINRLYHLLQQAPPLTQNHDTSDVTRLCAVVKAGSLAFGGISAATLTRGTAWDFLRLGCLLERADKTSRLLDVKYFLLLPSAEHVNSALDQVQWASMLRSVSALEMYRKRYGAITPPHVVQFLILDPEFPRAVLHCLTQARLALKHIAAAAPEIGQSASRRLGRLHADFAFGTYEEIREEGIHECLDRLQTRLNLTGKAIAEAYFYPTQPAETGEPVQSQSAATT